MHYFLSDLHGEYDLFCTMLEKIGFSDTDELYVCGDIIDKGPHSTKLLRLVFSCSNIHCIMGNHEHAFLQYYHSLMARSPDDFDAVLTRLRQYFPAGGEGLDWELIDRLEELPYYLEGEDFLCVHAGLPLRPDGTLLPFAEISEEVLVNDRRFKNASVVHTSPQCVFFGHTPTSYLCGEPHILAYLRENKPGPYRLQDYFKVHLDTGAHQSGVLGCFCAENCRAYYVKKASACR